MDSIALALNEEKREKESRWSDIVIWLLFGDVFTRDHSARYGHRIADSAYFVPTFYHQISTQGHTGKEFSIKLEMSI